MKKFLAVIMALIMSFSVALVPVAAAEAEQAPAQDEVTVADVINAIETTLTLIMDTMIQIHNIVGQIMAVLEKECPLCGVVHEVLPEAGTEDEVVEDEVVEDEVGGEEVPEIEVFAA